MIEINLIPDVKQELIRAERTRSLVITASIFTGIIALGIVVILALYVFAVQGVRNTFADNAIKDQSEKLASVEDLSKVLTIQNQLSKINALNDTKKNESRIFDTLAAVVPPSPNGVLFTNISTDADTKIMSLSGQTRSYDSLEVFKKTLEGAVIVYTKDGQETSVPLAQSISIGNVGYGEDTEGNKSVGFDLTFTYPDELFLASVKSPVIKLTNAGNVTDSYLGVPKSIFINTGGNL